MDVITVSQPWATLLMGDKLVENRQWRYNKTGPLAIHAGKGTQYLTVKQLRDMPNGILGWAETVACYHVSIIRERAAIIPDEFIGETQRTWKEIANSTYTEGRFCIILGPRWMLNDPLKASGMQGVWRYEGIEDLPATKIDSLVYAKQGSSHLGGVPKCSEQ